jgi:hypothetical protein
MAGHTLHFVKGHASIGTGSDAEAATATCLCINKYETIFILGYGSAGTYICAYRIIALKAKHWDEIHVEFPLNLSRTNRYHPAPAGLSFNREIMFLATGYRTGITPYTIVNINQ